jgi:hypothetical protein
MNARVVQGLLTVLLAGATTVAVVPSAMADTSSLPAPTLTSAIYYKTTLAGRLGEVVLDFTNPPASDAVNFVVYADGQIATVAAYPVSATADGEDYTEVWICPGLDPSSYLCDSPDKLFTGQETYTIRAQDEDGNLSQPSNGLVPAPAS